VAELKEAIAKEAPKPARLELQSEGTSFALGDKRLRIGRLAANEITLADSNISRQHAEVVPVEDGYEIIDLGSTNGTLVNDERIHSRLLAEGDRITLGTTTLVFRGGSHV